jgi:hypothetical protein
MILVLIILKQNDANVMQLLFPSENLHKLPKYTELVDKVDHCIMFNCMSG